MKNKENWIWMPHPGHFIMSRDCRFVLNTCVGNYIVSTVGECFPDSVHREIIAKINGIQLCGEGDSRAKDYMKKIGYYEIGCNRTYETMVFSAVISDKICCPRKVREYTEVDFLGYNSADEAYKGHLLLCEKWSEIN